MTLDPLDMSIADAHAHWQSLPNSVRFTNYFFKASTDPKRWEDNVPADWEKLLTWSEFRYKDVTTQEHVNTSISSAQSGVYVFYIRPDFQIGVLPSHVLYVGMAGATESGRPLRERLGDYLPSRVAGIRKRKNVHRMLMLFHPVIYVLFATSDKSGKEIHALEKKLYDYLWPMFTDDDFQPETKAEQQAWSIAI